MRIMNVTDHATATVAEKLFFTGARNVNEAMAQLAALRNINQNTMLVDADIEGLMVKKENENKTVREFLMEFDHNVTVVVDFAEEILAEAA